MSADLWNHDLVGDQVPDGASLRVALVSCGKSKAAHPAPARDLYTGSLFRAARRYVEASGYDAWWILSARHGLVHPDEIIRPYEATLAGRSVEDLQRWANKVDSRLRCANYGVWSQHGGSVQLDIYAGRAYVDPLLPMLQTSSWEVSEPHRGLQIGERLAALRSPIQGGTE